MIDVKTIADLFQHMEWADAQVWAAVMGSESGSADTRIKDTLYHIHIVQRAFLRAWRGEPRDTPYPSFDDSRALLGWARTYYGEAFSHLDSLDDEKLSEPMPLPWAEMVEKRLGRMPATTSVGDTALQVALHSLYHRGQVNSRLREVGGEPPLVDYIAWIWLGRPRAVWPGVGSG